MIDVYQRKAKFTELKAYCPFSKDSDFMEVCEWYNGEGFDVNISDQNSVSLTWGQWEALQALVAYRETK
jgi:NADPH-dependent 7-cyano-7-deazaguanine reductase QueF